MNTDLLLLRGLKGAPLSVLLALRLLGRAGTNLLMRATGYDDQAVTLALRTLGDLGFAVQVGRYNGWQLTPAAVQLPLFIPAQLADGRESGFSGLPQGGGGLSTLSDNRLINLTTTTSESGFSGLPPEFAALPETLWAEAVRLAEILVERLTCDRGRARAAVVAALERGEAPAHVELQLLQWAGFLADAHNRKGLRTPGLYVARKLGAGEPPPPGASVAWTDWARGEELRRELRGELSGNGYQIDGSPTTDEPTGEPAGGSLPTADDVTAEPADRELWEQVRRQLRLQLPRSTYETWVRDTELLRREDAADGDTFVVGVGNAYARDWLTLRLRPLVERTLRGVAGPAAQVAFHNRGQEGHDGTGA